MDAVNESCVMNDGSITLTVTGGTGNLIYQWNPNVSSSNMASGLSASVLYSVMVTDENGNSSTYGSTGMVYKCSAGDCSDVHVTPQTTTIIDEAGMPREIEASIIIVGKNGERAIIHAGGISFVNANNEEINRLSTFDGSLKFLLAEDVL